MSDFAWRCPECGIKQVGTHGPNTLCSQGFELAVETRLGVSARRSRANPTGSSVVRTPEGGPMSEALEANSAENAEVRGRDDR